MTFNLTKFKPTEKSFMSTFYSCLDKTIMYYLTSVGGFSINGFCFSCVFIIMFSEVL